MLSGKANRVQSCSGEVMLGLLRVTGIGNQTHALNHTGKFLQLKTYVLYKLQQLYLL